MSIIDTLKEMFTSKKAIAALVAGLSAFFASLFNMPIENITAIVAPIVAYILGQSLADHGKEAAKVDLQAKKIEHKDK